MSQLILKGTYLITNVFSNLCLKPAGNNQGSSIVAGRSDDSDAFKWIFSCIDVQDNTYIITNNGNSFVAYVPDNSPAGINVTEDICSQRWVISLVAGTTDTYNIYLGATQAYWSVDSTVAGTPVVLRWGASSDHTQFKIITVTDSAL